MCLVSWNWRHPLFAVFHACHGETGKTQGAKHVLQRQKKVIQGWSACNTLSIHAQSPSFGRACVLLLLLLQPTEQMTRGFCNSGGEGGLEAWGTWNSTRIFADTCQLALHVRVLLRPTPTTPPFATALSHSRRIETTWSRMTTQQSYTHSLTPLLQQ